MLCNVALKWSILKHNLVKKVFSQPLKSMKFWATFSLWNWFMSLFHWVITLKSTGFCLSKQILSLNLGNAETGTSDLGWAGVVAGGKGQQEAGRSLVVKGIIPDNK